MTLPNIRVYFRTASSFNIGGNFTLGTTTLGAGSLLGTPVGADYEISTVVRGVTVRRGRTRVTESFDAGRCTIEVVDQTGLFNPSNTSSALYGYIEPLRHIKVTATVGGSEYLLFRGFTESFNYQYQTGFNASVVTIECVDMFRLLHLASLTTAAGVATGYGSSGAISQTLTTGESSGSRITKLLAAAGAPNSLYSIETGQTSVDLNDDGVSSALDLIQQCEASELGAFWIDPSGIAQFLGRHSIQKLAAGITATPLVINETSGIPFVGLTQRFDDEQILNDVSVSDSSGTIYQQTDTASISKYFARSASKSGTLIQTGSEATDHAKFLLGYRSTPELHIDNVQLNASALSDANLISILNSDLLDPVTVSKNYCGTTLTKTLTIQGISHDISPDSWMVALETAEPIAGEGFILDSSTYGVLDTNVLSF